MPAAAIAEEEEVAEGGGDCPLEKGGIRKPSDTGGEGNGKKGLPFSAVGIAFGGFDHRQNCSMALWGQLVCYQVGPSPAKKPHSCHGF